MRGAREGVMVGIELMDLACSHVKHVLATRHDAFAKGDFAGNKMKGLFGDGWGLTLSARFSDTDPVFTTASSLRKAPPGRPSAPPATRPLRARPTSPTLPSRSSRGTWTSCSSRLSGRAQKARRAKGVGRRTRSMCSP